MGGSLTAALTTELRTRRARAAVERGRREKETRAPKAAAGGMIDVICVRGNGKCRRRHIQYLSVQRKCNLRVKLKIRQANSLRKPFWRMLSISSGFAKKTALGGKRDSAAALSSARAALRSDGAGQGFRTRSRCGCVEGKLEGFASRRDSLDRDRRRFSGAYFEGGAQKKPEVAARWYRRVGGARLV